MPIMTLSSNKPRVRIGSRHLIGESEGVRVGPDDLVIVLLDVLPGYKNTPEVVELAHLDITRLVVGVSDI